MTTTDPRSAPTGAPIGHAASTSSAQGFPYDASEFTVELMWPYNIAIYDRMRRTDAQVKSVTNAITLPIRRCAVHIDANGAPPAVAEAIAFDLGLPILGSDAMPPPRRERGRFNWHHHVRLACLNMSYGHMPFEVVGEIQDDGLWHLRRLEERLPPTIAKINAARNGDLESIEQYPSGNPDDASKYTGPYDVITSDRLVMYSHEREGSLWQGQSIYRSAYRNWLIKDRLIRVDAMKHERNGLGVPGFEAPPNASQKVMDDLAKIASAFRVGEDSGLAWPNGAKFTLTGVSGQLPDTIASIKYHDEQIAREALAQFLELVSSSHGSRALATSLIDFFIMSLQAAADEIASAFNEQLIERWVDWNWGSEVPAPRLVFDDLGAETAITAEAIAQLVNSGAVVADESLDSWLRDNYRMPARSGALNPPPPAHETQPAPTPVASPVAAGRRLPFRAASLGTTETAPDWPGKSYLVALVNHYASQVQDGLAATYDTAAIARAALDGVAPRKAITMHRGSDHALTQTLTTMYQDAYLTGWHSADEQVDALGVAPRTVAWAAAGDPSVEPSASGVDWDSWTPGSPDAAALVALDGEGGNGLADLLADAGITLDGIDATTLDRMATAIEQALLDGDSVDTLAADLASVLGDAARAEIIAQTELARAMTVATLDQYEANGIASKAWLLSDGACPLCVENDDEGAIPVAQEFTNGDPPVHPNCVCAVEPVVSL